MDELLSSFFVCRTYLWAALLHVALAPGLHASLHIRVVLLVLPVAAVAPVHANAHGTRVLIRQSEFVP